MPLPSLARLPATPQIGHPADQAEILVTLMESITKRLEALNAKVTELEERQQAFETQLNHALHSPSPSHDSDDKPGGGSVLWGPSGGS